MPRSASRARGRIIALVAAVLLAPAASLTFGSTHAAAGCGGTTLTWNGSVSGHWGTAANWTPNAVPSASYCLVFPSGGGFAGGMTNDIASLSVINITFTAGGYSTNGNPVTTDQLTDTAPGLVDFGAEVTGPPAGPFQVTVSDAAGTMEMDAKVTANNGLSVFGPGLFYLNFATDPSPNQISAVTVDGASGGQVKGVPGGFGFGTVTVNSGGAVILANNPVFFCYSNPMVLNGTGPGGAGALQTTGGGFMCSAGDITLGSDTTITAGVVTTLKGKISGAHQLTFRSNSPAGSFGLDPSTASTYSGGTVIATPPPGDTGIVVVFAGGALGTGTVTVQPGAVLTLATAAPYSMDLHLGGALSAQGSGSPLVATWSGRIFLDAPGASTSMVAQNSDELHLTGQVSGTDPLSFSSSAGGLLAFDGSVANIDTGAIDVGSGCCAGRVQLNDAGGVAVAATAIAVEPNYALSALRDNQLLAAAALTLNGPNFSSPASNYILNGHVQTLAGLSLSAGEAMSDGSGGTLTLAGPVTTAAAAQPSLIGATSGIPGTLSTALAGTTFTVARGTATQDLRVAAIVTGLGGITKSGPGIMELSGANTYAGTTLQAGTLLVDGNQAGAGAVSAQSGSTLGGTGTVGNVTSSGATVEAGDIPAPGALTTGNLGLDNASTFVVPIKGATAGSQYSQVVAGGSVTLGGATLQVNLGFTPTAGQSFTILRKTSGGPIPDTFHGLPEGTVFTAGGVQFAITYRGNGGNDVVLTVPGGPTPPGQTPTPPAPQPPVPPTGAAAAWGSWPMIPAGVALIVVAGWRRRRAPRLHRPMGGRAAAGERAD